MRIRIAYPNYTPDPDPGTGTKTPEEIAAAKTADAAAASVAEKAAADKAAADAKVAADAETARLAALNKAKAPEKYELKLPEKNPHLDATDLSAVEALAKAEGWTNEEAQAELEARGTALAGLSTKFLEATKADKEYGGDKFPETERLALLALNTLRPAGTPRGDSVRSMLNKTGFGNHVEWISLLADIGKLMAEDGHMGGGAGGGSQTKDLANKLYPNMAP